MSLFIYLAWQLQSDKSVKTVPVYVGEDGAAGEAAWAKAIEDGSVIRGVRFSNPSNGAPLPIDPTPIKVTKPVFKSNSKPFEHPEIAEPPKSIADAEQKTREERSFAEQMRQARLAMTGGDHKPRSGPPTFEEFVKAGYPAEAYPLRGFPEVDTPGLREYRAKQQQLIVEANEAARAAKEAEANRIAKEAEEKAALSASPIIDLATAGTVAEPVAVASEPAVEEVTPQAEVQEEAVQPEDNAEDSAPSPKAAASAPSSRGRSRGK